MFLTRNNPFEAGARAFKSRQPCRPPLQLNSDDAQAWKDGFWEAASEDRAEHEAPPADKRQLQLFGVNF